MGFFDDIIGGVTDFFSSGIGSSIVSAGIKTAGQFIIGGGGGGGQQSGSSQPALQSKIAGSGARTSRIGKPETPGQA